MVFSQRYSGMALGPLTSTLANMGKVAPNESANALISFGPSGSCCQN